MFLKNNKNTNTAEVGTSAANSRKSIPSVLSHGTHILGNVLSDGAVDIDGTLEGNVKGEQVTIRQNGKICGDIVAHSVHIYGEVRGIVRAHEVHLYSSCVMSGVIVHHSLAVEEGAFIDAKLKRVSETVNYRFDGEESEGDTESGGLIESAPAFVGNATLRLIG